MFGRNPTLPLENQGDGTRLDVFEMFSTIQGEGPLAGRPATFVRLHGCHLKCHFCDTDFTSRREDMAVADIVRQCDKFRHDLVVLTGGEPMRQNLVPLIVSLLQEVHTVQIETAGSFWFPSTITDEDKLWVHRALEHRALTLVVSPKTPAVHPSVAKSAHAWKYIITDNDVLDPDDGLPVCNYQDPSSDAPQRLLARPPVELNPRDIYVQPCDYGIATRNKAAQDRCVQVVMRHGYTLSLQQHKLVGLP